MVDLLNADNDNILYHTIDYNRVNINVQKSLVREVLPEHFLSDYPNIVTFLEGYYDYHEADEYISLLKDLYAIRDIERADAAQLDRIFEEIAAGASREYFKNPREVLRNFANFYRVKGTKYSAEGFFRAFFGIDVEIQYPKNNVFIVGESEIGVESLRFIINNGLYQIFSVLIRSSLPINRWRELYKRFVHPAGWFLGGEVLIEQTGVLWGLDVNPFLDIRMPDVIPGEAEPVELEGVATLIPLQPQVVEMIGVLEDGIDPGDASTFISLNARIAKFANFTAAQLLAAYGTIDQVMHVNSPTFDDEYDSAFYPTPIIRFDNEAETMDQNWWRRAYDSLNENYMFSGYVDSDYVELTP